MPISNSRSVYITKYYTHLLWVAHLGSAMNTIKQTTNLETTYQILMSQLKFEEVLAIPPSKKLKLSTTIRVAARVSTLVKNSNKIGAGYIGSNHMKHLWGTQLRQVMNIITERERRQNISKYC